MRRPTPSKTIRNGLKWRDGRPRWEPSPASRALGLKGCDLKDLEGRFLTERGFAIAAADARSLWAQMIREAAASGPIGDEARADLRAALEELAEPTNPEQRLRRAHTADLIAAARQLLDGQDAAAGVTLTMGVKSVEALVAAYFEAVDAGRLRSPITPNTRKGYKAQEKAFLARFKGRGVASIRRKELTDWYDDLVEGGESLSNAALRLAAASAWLTYAVHLEWIAASPAVKLGLKKAKGRLVFWTLPEERAFTSWCDANGFPDVADAVVFGLWTGARPIDMCVPDVEDLAGDVWRFVPIKTKKREQLAMPGLLNQVKARVERRRAAALADPIRHLNTTPFLWDHRTRRRHTPATLRNRYLDALALALDARAVPATLATKRLQDMRDTCITRLWEADVKFDRMWAWTGHSRDGLERILQEHYINLRAAGMLELAQQLQAWADKEAVAL